MAQEVLIVLAVVIPDEPPESRAKIRDLHGRELPGVPGSWVTRVAIHPAPATARHRQEQSLVTGSEGTLTTDEVEHELDLDFGTSTSDT